MNREKIGTLFTEYLHKYKDDEIICFNISICIRGLALDCSFSEEYLRISYCQSLKWD